MSEYKCWTVASRPEATIEPKHFELSTGELPAAGSGEMLIEVLWLILTPPLRMALTSGGIARKPIPIGAVMRSNGLGRVLQSDLAGFNEGDLISGPMGWQTHLVSNGAGMAHAGSPPFDLPQTTLLHVLGSGGATAYVGMPRATLAPLFVNSAGCKDVASSQLLVATRSANGLQTTWVVQRRLTTRPRISVRRCKRLVQGALISTSTMWEVKCSTPAWACCDKMPASFYVAARRSTTTIWTGTDPKNISTWFINRPPCRVFIFLILPICSKRHTNASVHCCTLG